MINFLRQKDLFDNEIMNSHKIAIIGCGGIGSPTALTLAKMGFPEITLIDKDVVETYNIPSQFHFNDCLGVYKAESLKNTIKAFIPDVTINVVNELASVENLDDHTIVISAVDSMKARSEIWEMLPQLYTMQHFIEGRMSAEAGMIFTINDFHTNAAYKKKYTDNCLYSDEEAVADTCTAKAIIYNTILMGGWIAAITKQIISNYETPKFERLLDTKNILFV